MNIEKYTWAEVNEALETIDTQAHPQRKVALEQHRAELATKIKQLESEYHSITGKSLAEPEKPLSHTGKLVFHAVASASVGLGVIILLLVLSALLGADTIKSNGHYIHDLSTIFFGLTIWFFGSLFLGLCSLSGAITLRGLHWLKQSE
ncbi:hypothetical protein [Gallaecimonas sp. GXIMD1310]|uniref:hypothetical protein n=1 Tax=Gallaecimonas sp. GXIMD1310 TaxID=3131926 RepID=UPI0032442A2F